VELDLLLSCLQYGFRKGRSCDDCIALLLLKIYKGFITHNHPMGVLFLDIKRAYDNVNPNILFDIVNTMKISIHYKNFVHNLIRYINFYKNGKFHGSSTLYKSLLQGSTHTPRPLLLTYLLRTF